MTQTIFPSSVDQIYEDLEKLVSNDEFTFTLTSKKKILRELQKTAARHSVQIEFPGPGPSYKGAKRNIPAEEIEKYIKAWKVTKEAIKREEGKKLEHIDFSIIARTLHPKGNYSLRTGYRNQNVTISGATYQPPSCEAVKREMETLIYEIEQLDNPIKKAILSHYHTARIHPMPDGNGRTARLVQNGFLRHHRYPPIIIPSKERDLYLSILDSTDKQYYNDDPKYLVTFSEYAVSKLAKAMSQYAK